MIGDYFTKPLHGDRFRKFWENISNIQPGDDGSNHLDGIYSQECVEE